MTETTDTATSPTTNFIDEILAEAEAAEGKQLEAYYDLVLADVQRLETEIETNFSIAEKEKELIDSWAMSRNTKLQERIDFLAKKLEAFIRSQDVKTIDMPHGKISIRKRPDKVEVVDLDAFLAAADHSLLNSVPETVKPDLNAIKKFVKMTGGKLPVGCKIIPGEEAFSYKLTTNNKENTNGETEAGTPTERTEDS